MASHFSSIGMPVNTERDMIKVLDKASEAGEKIACEFGYYQKWSSGTGAELWIHIDKSGEVIGVNPFYNGESNIPAGLINKVKNEKYNDFECMFYAWVDPKDNEPGMGLYPLAFDCVNIALVEGLVLPCIRNVRLSAFAYDLDIYPDEENYHVEQKKLHGDDHYYGAKSFIPSGTFSFDDDDDGNAEESFEIKPEAIFTGIIMDYKKYKNELTGKKYFWIRTETYGGIIDVVADPELINREMKINGVISGQFYMCGKIIT